MQLARRLGGPLSPSRGALELTLGEQLRWTFPCASLSPAVLMISLRRRHVRRGWLLCAVVPIVTGYHVLMFVSRGYAMSHDDLLVAAAWMTNVFTVLAAAVISAFGVRRQVTV